MTHDPKAMDALLATLTPEEIDPGGPIHAPSAGEAYRLAAAPKPRADYKQSVAELGQILREGQRFVRDTSGWSPFSPTPVSAEEASLASHQERVRYLNIPPAFEWACCPLKQFVSYRRGRYQREDFANNVRDKNGRLFIGATYSGKTSIATHLFWCLTREDKKTHALWLSAPMFEAMHAGREERDARYRRAKTTDLLLLDDLGTEQVSAYGSGCSELIALRTNQHLETWVTTGLEPDVLISRYGAQIWERIRERARVFAVGGA